MSAGIVEYATRLLNVSGIEKVISIDDDNTTSSSPEELLAVLSVVDQEVLTKVIGPLLSIESGDRDLIRDRVRSDWADLAAAVKSDLLSNLTPPVQHGIESVALQADLRATSQLPELFGDKLVSMTLAEWEKRRDEIVNDAMPATLLLVDLSFTGEQRGKDEGLRVIADLLRMHPETKIYCGLLTSLYKTSSVHDDWKKIAEDHGLDRERFVLIPKDSLTADKSPFLALIKLVVMNSPANTLRKAVGRAFDDCLKQSDEELGKLDVYEFERIVCLSSSVEGAWEPDTLLRVFSLFHKKFVRKALHDDREVYKAADVLRELTGVRVGEWGGPTQMEVSLRRLEWFDEGSDINKQHLPLELGDVFRIERLPERLYVLVAQPCDLMMRQTGERHPTVKNGLLLEATPISESVEKAAASSHDSSFYFRLEFFEPDRDWRISLRKIQYVNLDVLDLCAFQQDGYARLSLGTAAPALISEAWRARFPRLANTMKKACIRYSELRKKYGLPAEDASKLAFTASLGTLIASEIDLESNTIAFDISRVGRVKQPRSGALLARYANLLARDAFEHDLTRRPAGAEAKALGALPSQSVSARVSDSGHET